MCPRSPSRDMLLLPLSHAACQGAADAACTATYDGFAACKLLLTLNAIGWLVPVTTTVFKWVIVAFTEHVPSLQCLCYA